MIGYGTFNKLVIHSGASKLIHLELTFGSIKPCKAFALADFIHLHTEQMVVAEDRFEYEEESMCLLFEMRDKSLSIQVC